MTEKPSNADAVALLSFCHNFHTSHVKSMESIIRQSPDPQKAKSMLYMLKESQQKEKAGKVYSC